MTEHQPRGDEDLLRRLKQHEGRVLRDGRHVVYDDATGEPIEPGTVCKGWPTVGYGRNLIGNGLSEAEAMELLRADVAHVRRALRYGLPWLRDLSDARKDALLEMGFNLGVTGLFGFNKMLAAMRDGDFDAAADEALDSRWARQVGQRANDIAKRIKEG